MIRFKSYSHFFPKTLAGLRHTLREARVLVDSALQRKEEGCAHCGHPQSSHVGFGCVEDYDPTDGSECMCARYVPRMRRTPRRT